LNDDNSEGDWYMVNKTFSSSPGSGNCNSARQNFTQALYPAENYFAGSTTVFDHCPTSTVDCETTGFSVGGGLDGKTPTADASYSVSWNSSAVDTSDLTPAVAGDYTEWQESFTDKKSPSSTATYTSYNSTIFTMPQGTPPFNVVTAEKSTYLLKCQNCTPQYSAFGGQTAILVTAPVLSVPPYPVQIAPGGTASPSGTFTSFAPMTVGRSYHTATRLPDGRVLVAGGQQGTVHTPTQLQTAEICCGLRSVLGPPCPWLPTACTMTVVQQYFVATADMAVPRAGYSATTLQNGQILIAGGYNQVLDGPTGEVAPISEAELFDPTALTFSVTRRLLTPSAYHIAVVPAAP
jgi:hypothetical protein